MYTHIKICGITNTNDALLAEQLGASAIGFVFYKKSPRFVLYEEAREISGILGPFIARVGVFVDENPDVVMNTIHTVGLTAVQLHGSENADYIHEISGVRIIKAFRIGKNFDPGLLGHYNVSAYLLDTYNKNGYGGTGKTFDWEKALACSRYGRIILAGGLNAGNISNAIKTVNPWGVDVSSGLEVKPGKKDEVKMRLFFEAVYREYIK
ncbi:MAG: phosphoribosylanthranilate isomerase [Candidatus Latescibacteria bacterium]|nr:phosphoribosylanthranilate isomerase [Candidatus Latescibacterota bacterium]